MKETKIIVNLGKNFIGHKTYVQLLAYFNNVNIKSLKIEKNRMIINIESNLESRNKFIKLVCGKLNFFEVKSINYRY